MEAFGGRLVSGCASGGFIYLQGELGAGKTTLVRGFLRQLGYQGSVKSPTYTLLEPYELAGRHIYHFDLYRLAGVEELEAIGARDYFIVGNTCLVEWPERGEGLLPQADIYIRVSYDGKGRRLKVSAPTTVEAAVFAGLVA